MSARSLADHSDVLARAAGVVVPYDSCFGPDHQRFVRETFGERRKRWAEPYLRYVFRAGPTGPIENLLLARIEGRVVGQIGAIPCRLEYAGQTFEAQWACQLMVDPRYRGRGLGTLLFASCAARRPMTLGSDPTAGSDAIQERLGFLPLQGPSRMVLPIEPDHVMSWKCPPRLRAALPLAALLLRPACRVLAGRLRSTNWRGVELVEWSELATQIEERCRPGAARVIHDREFLRWRCEERSPFPAQLPQALRGPNGGYALFKGAGPYCYVYDWSASGAAETQQLFAALYQFAREQGRQTLYAFAQGPVEVAALRRLGLLRMRQPVMLRYHAAGNPIPAGTPMVYQVYDADGDL